jgi:hypothetical protein
MEAGENYGDAQRRESYIHEIGSFSDADNPFPMNPKDLPKLTLEEARKRYIGKNYTHKAELELSWMGYGYTVSMTGKITGVFGPATRNQISR